MVTGELGKCRDKMVNKLQSNSQLMLMRGCCKNKNKIKIVFKEWGGSIYIFVFM